MRLFALVRVRSDIALWHMLLRFNRGIALVHTTAKLVYTRTQATREFWQFLAAEQQKNDDHEENHFAHVGHTEEENHT